MPTPQKKVTSRQKPGPVIIDNRPIPAPEAPAYDPAHANKALRTVIFIEVNDMQPAQVQLLVQEVNKSWDGAKGGIHYVIPIRHGKIGTDILFETEFLKVVNEVCEIRDGCITLKGDATDAHITRTQLH